MSVLDLPRPRRVRALKARMLSAASTVMGEAVSWDAPYQYAEELGLTDEDAERVCGEISAELYRRALAITDVELMEMLEP